MAKVRSIEYNNALARGRLLMDVGDRWRVSCAGRLCYASARVRNASYKRAAEMLRDGGWTERHGIWTCPECAGGADNEQHAG